jgi:hypothetical protein
MKAMTFKNLRNLDKDEILSLLGLETKTSTAGWLASTLGMFGMGLLVGAGVALMLAPKAGHELRGDIKSRLRRAPDDLSDTVGISGRDPLGSGSSNKAY